MENRKVYGFVFLVVLVIVIGGYTFNSLHEEFSPLQTIETENQEPTPDMTQPEEPTSVATTTDAE